MQRKQGVQYVQRVVEGTYHKRQVPPRKSPEMLRDEMKALGLRIGEYGKRITNIDTEIHELSAEKLRLIEVNKRLFLQQGVIDTKLNEF